MRTGTSNSPERTLVFALLVGLFACQGEIDEPAVEPAPTPDYEPSPGRLHRLTSSQYRHAIADVFGDDIVPPPQLEPVRRIEGLEAIGAATGSISARGVEQYEEAAFSIAEQVLAPGRASVPCAPSGVTDDACTASYLRQLARRLWRRPVARDELAQLVDIAHRSSTTLGDYREGLTYALAALLQSPHFLFRTEIGQVQDTSDWRRLDPFEVAERLSFFLWDTLPDDALLEAAARGDMSDPEAYALQVDRMLADPRSRQGVRAIFTDMLELDRLDGLRKDPTVFAHMSPEVGPAAREETLRVVEDIVFDRQADYREIFTTRTTFINRKLASIYGVPAPAREGFARYEHESSTQRSGILGHVSTLALHSHVTASSATLRGAFVRRTLLCGEIPPPPADVDTSIPEPLPGALTLRDRVRRHLEVASCAGCHARMDPLGLGLENFDALGRFRSTDNGADIDASGTLDGVFYRNPIEMGAALAGDPSATRCLTLTLHRYATGRRESRRDGEPIGDLDSAFAASGYRVLTLLRAIAVHPSFQLVTGGAR